jgi:hypothetical protein
MSITRASGVLLLLLATACPREARRPPVARPESPAAPASAAPASPAPASAAPAGAAPPAPGMRLTVTETNQAKEQECSRADLLIELLGSDGKAVGEETLAGECHGACTPAAKRAGEREVRRIERAIERGEASDSELDYNFTGCQFSGAKPGRVERVGDRDVALLVDHYIGAHDVEQDRYLLATEVCGALFVSEPFAETYVAGWTLDELSLALSSDGRELRVEGAREESRDVLYRLTFPSQCPGEPVTEVVQSDE